MKNFKLSIAYLAVFALIFTSCSKEEQGGANENSDMATLSFGAILNDLATNRASKQSTGDLPNCSNSDDTPAYVRIVLMQGDEEVVGTSTSPYRVNLVAGEIFTVEDAELELEPGNYTLEHFSVYNSDNEVIWLAPRAGSDFGAYVNTTLPLAIDLRAGVKKYVDVSVLCFDNREVNQYGYLFFELDTNVALTYCFFANYCNNEDRHYPASYSISIWSGSDANGVALYTSETNVTGQHNNGDYYATPLCLALPDNDDLDEEYLYYEMTLLDWEGNYGDVENVVISGTITKREILANFGDNEDDNIEYEHVKFCGDDGEPMGDRDNDNIPDNVDECPDTAGPASNNGCPEEVEDADGDGVTDSVDECENTPAGIEVDAVGCPVDTGCVYEEECDIDGVDPHCNLVGGINYNLDYHFVSEANNFFLHNAIQVVNTAVSLGDIKSSYDNNGNLVIGLTAYEGFSFSGYVLEVRPLDPATGNMSETCREISCNSENPGETFSETFVNVQEGEEYYIRLKAFGCPDDADLDGTPDATDVCPQDPGPATNFGCPIDTECVYEEGCEIADAEFPCLNFTTWGTNNSTGSNPNFDFYQVGFIQGGGNISNPATGQTLGGYTAQINEDGYLEVYFQIIPGKTLSAYVIEVRPLDPETGKASENCREIICNNNVTLIENPPYASTTDKEVFSSINETESFFIRIEAIGCL